MSDDLSLFGGDEPEATDPAAETSAPISPWQVDLLRKALDARGLSTMDERREAVEAVVGHPVASLATMSQDDALHALAGLGDTKPAGEQAGSAWDRRDEDTWIDRL